MSDEMISRERASTVRLVCQSAAAVFVAGAALVAVLGSPFGSEPEVTEVAYDEIVTRAQEINTASESAGTERAEDDGVLPVDIGWVAETIALVKNAPKPKEEPAPKPVETPSGEPDDPVEADGRTRFLGTVRVGGRYLALLSAGGAQRILGEGDSRTLPLMPGDQGDPPTVTVHEVTADSVRLTENDVERTVERAARVGMAVSQGAAPSPASPAGVFESADDRAAIARAASGSTGGDDRPINPDDFRREDGTIDYESLRAAARERAKARRERLRQNEENGDEN
jgi:hypothetical protein